MTDPTPHVLVDVDAIEHMLKTDSFPDDEEWADATGWLIAEIRRLRGTEAWRENVQHMAEQFDEIERLRAELGVLRAQRDAAATRVEQDPDGFKRVDDYGRLLADVRAALGVQPEGN
jgi:hypothetical protein